MPQNTASQASPLTANQAFLHELRGVALRALRRMYRPEAGLFVWCLRQSGNRIAPEGASLRYTAITLIGLAGEDRGDARAILSGGDPAELCARLIRRGAEIRNLGDAALLLWAAQALGQADREPLHRRIRAFAPLERPCPTVELAWTLDACCRDPDSPLGALAPRIAGRLIAAFNHDAGLFPHTIGTDGAPLRAHVSCFADAVYPIHALANWHKASGDPAALRAAARCADRICAAQGAAGQWWWHYDYRTGAVIEGYPVYSVHQEAMAPMALFALAEAGGPDHGDAIQKGLDWMRHAPEIGATLVDREADVIWRKVARREPAKLTRGLQALASRIHPGIRVPGTGHLFPTRSIDRESRPYHMGWLLYAWPRERVDRWPR